MTITRTLGTKFLPSYVANTIVEIIHFRDMTFDADERVSVYLESANASMDLGSFNIAQFPQFEGDESDTEKVLLLNKSEANSNKVGLKILKRKNNTGTWDELAEIILVNRGRKDYLDLRSYTGYPTRIMERNDAIALQLVDYGDGLLWDKDFISIDFGVELEIVKKNDVTTLENRLAILESIGSGLIQTKIITGISGVAGSTAPVAHGLNASKIIGVACVAGKGTPTDGTGLYPVSMWTDGGFGWYYDATNIYFDAGGSGVANAGFMFLIFYSF